MIAVVFHHFAFDKTLRHVPRFVIQSMGAFVESSTSSEEDYTYEEMQAILAMEKKKELKGQQ